MGDVFANGLEVSGKSVGAKTIAAFPDVCMTPPENPATPPGVPVPYPNFAMAGDTEKGTSTVKVKKKEINLKNKSDMKKTTGDEAGCAAKKGVITSKNTGKSYFKSWSMDVKAEGEPVTRMSDMTTNNHASPVGNTVTWPHIAKISPGGLDCKAILNEIGLHLHKHSQKGKNCKYKETGKESEHMLGNALMQNKRGSRKNSIPGFGKYSANTAPCLCMDGPSHGKKTEHAKKTRDQEAFKASLKQPDGSYRQPTVKEAVDAELKSVRKHHTKIKNTKPKKKQDDAMECLKAVIYDHLERVSDPKKTREEIEKTKLRVPGEGDHPATPASPARSAM